MRVKAKKHHWLFINVGNIFLLFIICHVQFGLWQWCVEQRLMDWGWGVLLSSISAGKKKEFEKRETQQLLIMISICKLFNPWSYALVFGEHILNLKLLDAALRPLLTLYPNHLFPVKHPVRYSSTSKKRLALVCHHMVKIWLYFYSTIRERYSKYIMLYGSFSLSFWLH